MGGLGPGDGLEPFTGRLQKTSPGTRCPSTKHMGFQLSGTNLVYEVGSGRCDSCPRSEGLLPGRTEEPSQGSQVKSVLLVSSVSTTLLGYTLSYFLTGYLLGSESP